MFRSSMLPILHLSEDERGIKSPQEQKKRRSCPLISKKLSFKVFNREEVIQSSPLQISNHQQCLLPTTSPTKQLSSENSNQNLTTRFRFCLFVIVMCRSGTCLSRSLFIVCVGMLRLQCEESDMGIGYIRDLPLH